MRRAFGYIMVGVLLVGFAVGMMFLTVYVTMTVARWAGWIS